MDAELSARLLIALSIAYGALVAVLAALAPPTATVAAIIGAPIVGGLWAVRAVFTARTDRHK